MINRFVKISGENRKKIPSRSIFPSVLGSLEWICALIVFGTIGFALIEGWSIGDGLYMTVITISTVGFGETNELTPLGRMFTSFLIFMSIIGMTCWTAQITTNFVSGELSGTFSARRIRKMIETLSGHTIIFGSGTMAVTIMSRLENSEKACVVIDNDEAGINAIKEQNPNALVINADPKCELALSDANIFSASHVIATLESDFDNLLISMTVKELDPDIKVIARTNDPRVASRMVKTGVDYVICPFQLSGDHVCDLVTGEIDFEDPLKI